MLSTQRQKAIEQATNKYPDLPPRAACMADFIETYCVFSKGGHIGKPFVLIPWQLDALAGIYPGNPGDVRIITRVLISMARKGGKTEFCSALVLGHLCGPEAGIGQQLVCAAAANEGQAAHVFKGAMEMARAHPAINPHMTYRVSNTYHRMVWKHNTVNNYVHTISKNPSAAQGMLPTFWTYDEIAEAKDRELYDSLHYAQTDKRTGGLGIIVSTRSTLAQSQFAEIHDDVVLGQQQGRNKNWYVKVYSADTSKKNLYTMEQVKRANPSMGYILSEADLKADLEDAIANVHARPGFRARRLNIESGSSSALVDPQAWADRGVKERFRDLYNRMKGERVVLSTDLGSTTSLTSVGLYFPDHKLITVRSFMSKTSVEQNETLHKAPYMEWANDDLLALIESDEDGGMTYEPIADFIHGCFQDFDVKSWRYDGWNMSRMFDALAREPYNLRKDQYPLKGVIDPFPTSGVKAYGEAITEFLDLVLNGRITHDANPLTTMGINVCQVETKYTGGSDPAYVPEKNKQKLPNDPAIAVIMAVCIRDLVLPPKNRKSISDMWYNAQKAAHNRMVSNEPNRTN